MYRFITIAGLAGSTGTADGTNSVARFYLPSGITVDRGGNLFVADTASGDGVDTIGSTIRKITRAGTNWVTTTIAGKMGSWSSVDGTNTDARVSIAFGIAVSRSGTLFIADNETIRKIAPVGTNWVTSTIAGLTGSSGSADGTNNEAHFYYPLSVAVDNMDNVYVADSANYTIRKVTLIGTNWVTSTIAGVAGNGGLTDGTNNTARFDAPARLAFDQHSNLYVEDLVPIGNSPGQPIIRKLTLVDTNWSVSTPPWNQPGADYGPCGFAAGTADNIYLSCPANHTIGKLLTQGSNWAWSTVGGLLGSPGCADGTNGIARFWYPSAIAVDDVGNIYVADTQNHTIRMGVPLGAALQPVFLSTLQSNGRINFTWSAIAGLVYQAQHASNLTLNKWINFGANILATNETMSASDTIAQDPQTFYRIVLLP